jgi:hypothetical protein
LTYTPEQIEAAINEGWLSKSRYSDTDYEESGWDGLSYGHDAPDNKVTLTLQDGSGDTFELEVVEAEPGGEGHGEEVWIVVKVGDQLFKKDGYYASHYGTDWDGSFREVKAQQKYVTVYQ